MRLPDALNTIRAECTIELGVPTPEGKAFRNRIKSFPPLKWIDAKPTEHLEAARSFEKALQSLRSRQSRGAKLLRTFAAAHAMEGGRGRDISRSVESSKLLSRIGYTRSTTHEWELVEEASITRMGGDLRGRHVGANPQPPPKGNSFGSQYARMVSKLQRQLRTAQELRDLEREVQSLANQARCGREVQHLNALRGSIESIQACASCSGAGSRRCRTCRGKGRVTWTCRACNGKGFVFIAGTGRGSGNQTCKSCKGKPRRENWTCPTCRGRGRTDCAKCPSAFRVPAPYTYSVSRVCTLCNGRQTFGDKVRTNCPSCLGLGFQVVPSKNRKATLP